MKYLVKGTYQDGARKEFIGRTFYLIKGGYVSNNPETEIDEFCYNTLASAKRAATMYNKENERSKRVCEKNYSFYDVYYEAVAI